MMNDLAKAMRRWTEKKLTACIGKVSFDMEDDTTCTVPVHPEVAGDTWFGRTLDLSRAYKQLALDKGKAPHL